MSMPYSMLARMGLQIRDLLLFRTGVPWVTNEFSRRSGGVLLQMYARGHGGSGYELKPVGIAIGGGVLSSASAQPLIKPSAAA